MAGLLLGEPNALGALPDRVARCDEALSVSGTGQGASERDRARRPPPTRALDRGLRILGTLRARDFVTRTDAAKTHSVGVKAREVGARFLSETRLQETASVPLQRPARETGHIATLSILHGNQLVCIDIS